jgi:hypothetical protein
MSASTRNRIVFVTKDLGPFAMKKERLARKTGERHAALLKHESNIVTAMAWASLHWIWGKQSHEGCAASVSMARRGPE